jgi:hypothetical protein
MQPLLCHQGELDVSLLGLLARTLGGPLGIWR